MLFVIMILFLGMIFDLVCVLEVFCCFLYREISYVIFMNCLCQWTSIGGQVVNLPGCCLLTNWLGIDILKATSFGVIFISLQVSMSDEDATCKIFLTFCFLWLHSLRNKCHVKMWIFVLVNFDWICVDCCVFVLFDHSSKKYELLSGQL